MGTGAVFLLRSLSLPTNPPLDSRPTSRWSTEAARGVDFLFAIRKGGRAEFQSRLSNQTGSCRSHVPPMKVIPEYSL